jgi:hypothetical protein
VLNCFKANLRRSGLPAPNTEVGRSAPDAHRKLGQTLRLQSLSITFLAGFL